MKVLIIGSGITGSILGKELAKNGIDVKIIEEHPSPGYPVQCAGLVSRECFNSLGKPGKKALVNKIKGAIAYSPSGKSFEVSSKNILAVVLERKVLDVELLKSAINSGAEVSIKSYFSGIKNGTAVIRTYSGVKFEDFDVIAGCDGAGGKTGEIFGFGKPEKILTGLQIECRYRVEHEDHVEIFFGNNASPDFFGYAIPLDGETARIGIISREKAFERLKNMIEKHPAIKERVTTRTTEFNAGAIPIGLVDPFVKNRTLLVGDSAGQVKPYTGGGIYYGVMASKMAGDSILEYSKTGNIEALKNYNIKFKKEFGKEIETGMRIVKLYSILDDRDYEKLFQIAIQSNLSEILVKGDMDRPSSFIEVAKAGISLIKNPKNAVFFAKLLSMVMLDSPVKKKK